MEPEELAVDLLACETCEQPRRARCVSQTGKETYVPHATRLAPIQAAWLHGHRAGKRDTTTALHTAWNQGFAAHMLFNTVEQNPYKEK